MKKKKLITLRPIRTEAQDYDNLEKMIRAAFKKKLYNPLFEMFGEHNFEGSGSALADAIKSGKIFYSNGYFRGRLNAEISKDLKTIGAKWDSKQGAFKVSTSSVFDPIQTSFDLNTSELSQKIDQALKEREIYFYDLSARLKTKLEKLLPEDIAESMSLEKIFDRTLQRVDREFNKTIKGITISPTLTEDQRKKISSEYTLNMKKSIKDWSEGEIKSLRIKVEDALNKGERYESLVENIQEKIKKQLNVSYEKSLNKAKFLARQETNLISSKLKETRYADCGIIEYKWRTSAGSAAHPVRDDHLALNNKIFRFDDPPITNTKTGARNNPGEDFGCRCVAIPIVKF